MKNINKPAMLLYYITIPQCVMAVIMASSFALANELPSLLLALVFGFEFLLNIAVIIYYKRNKSMEEVELKALYAFLAGFVIIFSCGVVTLFLQFSSVSIISPETVYLLCGSVSLIYLSAAVIKRTNQAEKLNLPVIIALCLIMPVGIYQLLNFQYRLGDTILMLALGLFCVFLFLAGKLVFALYEKLKGSEQPGNDEPGYSGRNRMLIFVAAVILPQLGLLVNRNMLMENILGDFTSVWFYIIAAANGMLLLIDIKKTKYKLPVFYLKAAGFVFICYFALIFIPYMPYAVLGIMFFGLGLLVYVPAVIFVTQLTQLKKDARILKASYSGTMLAIVAAVGFLTLPTILAVNFNIDRANFQKAMTYINMEYDDQPVINIDRLNRSITQIEATIESSGRREFFIFTPGTPLISTAYRYIALENMYYTTDSLITIKKIFVPKTVAAATEAYQPDPDQELNKDFKTKLSTGAPEYDAASGAYKVWIDMELAQQKNKQLGEYAAEFILPEGCFVTDYYLYVGDEKKMGLMTDKRSAKTLYESIIRTARDPGIIYYINDNTLALRVFPFNGAETRKTGFQIMYCQNETLTIQGQTVHLTAEKPMVEPIHFDGGQFIPGEYKKSLLALERKPQYYFLIDAGEGALYAAHFELAKEYAKDNEINDPIYYAVSYQAKKAADTDGHMLPVVPEGGFNTAYAMSEIFSSVPEGRFPVMLLVTESINRTVPLEETRLAKAYPESAYYYRLNSDLSLTPYGFSGMTKLKDVNKPLLNKALDYNGAAVKDDGKSEVVLTDLGITVYDGSQYINAFVLQKNSAAAKSNADQVSRIKEAFEQRVLTKHTAFMVLETKEQEEELLSLQEKFLKEGGEGSPSVMMSEAGWGVVIAIWGIAAICNWYKRKKGMAYK